MKSVVVLILYLLAIESLCSQELYSINWDLENGLPSNQTYKVTQDNKGFIWICTDHGVVRYDGQSFKLFSTADGLLDNTVFRMYQDNRDRLWFLGMSGSLCYWDGNAIVRHPATVQISKILINQSIAININMAIDSNDVLYFTKPGLKGYYSVGVEDTMIALTLLEHELEEGGSLMFLNNKETLLISVRHGFRKELWSGAKKDQLLPYQNIKKLKNVHRDYQKMNEKRLFYQRDTVYLYDIAKNKLLDFKLKSQDRRVHFSYLDQNEQLWVATDDGLLFYGSAPFDRTPKLFFEGISLASIYQDKEGNYWISTLDKGIFFINNWDVFHFFKEGTGVSKLVHYKDQVYAVGGSDLYQLDTRTYPFGEKITEVSQARNLFDMEKIDDKLILSNGKLIDDKGNQWNIFEDGAFFQGSNGKTVFVDEEEKSVLIGCSSNLLLIKEDRSVNVLCEGSWINAIEKKASKEWLFGTTEGLCLYNERTNQLTNLGEKNAQLSQRVLTLNYFQEYLLVGTKGSGVLLLDPEDYTIVNQWTNKNGLASVFIHCVTIENDSTVWVGTNQGANRIKVVDGVIQDSRVFNGQNYLPSNGVNDILVEDSVVWLATDHGIAYVPKEVLLVSNQCLELPIYLKSMLVNGARLPLQETYELNYNQQNIVVDFLAISFNVSKVIEYRYQLKNSNKAATRWMYTELPQINYDNLAPGDYTLIIEVRTKSSEWQEKKLAIKFNINPHFTQTWSFFALILGGLFLVVVLYLRNVFIQKNIAKELAEAEQKSLRSQLKPHFLFNAINSVVYYLYKNQKKQAIKFLQKFSTLMRATLENTQHPLILLEQDLAHLQLYLDMEHERLSSGSLYVHNFYVEVEKGLNVQQWQVPPMLIQPLIENAIIHGLAPKEGDRTLRILLDEVNGNLRIKIEDNGIGRAAAKEIKKQFFIKKTSQGLKLLDQRIKTIYKLLNVQIKLSVEDVLDDPNCSTRFLVVFPLSLKNK